MAAQKGKALLLRIGNGAVPEVFTAVAGLRARTFTLNTRPVDITDSDSPGGWRELLAGAAANALSISGSGVFRDVAADAMVCNTFLAQTLANWQVVVPGFGTFSGPFLIATLEYSGQHDAEAAFALTLASAGAISFTAGS